MRRYYELDVLDTLAVDSVAYAIVSHAGQTIGHLKPETQFQVLDRALEGLDALRKQAREAYEAAETAAPPAEPE